MFRVEGTLKRCLKLSLRMGLAAALFFLGIWGVPTAFCEQVPGDAVGSPWTGEWQSSNYRSVKGKLFTRLPERISAGQQFHVVVEIYYDVDSFYKSGKTVKVDFEGMLTLDGRAKGGGNSENDTETAKKIRLKGRPSWSFHVIEYEALFLEDDNVITGVFKTKWPADNGEFTLRLSGQKKK